jgi:hypothetical protein
LKALIGICFLLLITGFLSCNEQEDDVSFEPKGTLIFGHFYGLCIGETCIETFKLEGAKLFEDTLDQYFGNTYSFIELSNVQYLNVENLKSKIPSQLLASPDETFGCPDCADGGGFFVHYQDAGSTKSWRIDMNKDNVPKYLHDFMDELSSKIALLQ